MSRRLLDMEARRRGNSRALAAPAKDRLYASGDDLLVARLRSLPLPSPPADLRERSYQHWLGSYGARNRWRD